MPAPVPKHFIVFAIRFLTVVLVVLIIFRISMLVYTPPLPLLGVTEGRFHPCVKTPSCVSTQENRRGFRARPVPFTSHPDTLQKNLAGWIKTRFNATLNKADSTYIHAYFKVPMLGSTDDLELYIDRENRLLHVRSISRQGPVNFGLNRIRIGRVRKTVHKKGW